jgi:hypothetical protein
MNSVCLLTDREVGRLVHYDLHPNHDDHIHITADAAIDGLKTEEYELIHHDNMQFCHQNKQYTVRYMKSGDIAVLQRTVGNPLKYLQKDR